MIIEVSDEAKMKDFGKSVGLLLSGGETLELVGDVGSGKTTLVKGIALGLGIDEYVQSPSFTINRIYDGRDGIRLSHYDFYRLDSAGIMANDLQESISNPKVVTVIEWASIVDGVLPDDRLSIDIVAPSETSRRLDIKTSGEVSSRIIKGLSS